MIESKTPITDSKSVIFNAGTEDQPEPFEVVEASDMRALELAANGLADASAVCFPYDDERAEIKAKALTAFATLQPSPRDAPRTA